MMSGAFAPCARFTAELEPAVFPLLPQAVVTLRTHQPINCSHRWSAGTREGGGRHPGSVLIAMPSASPTRATITN
jgi:hypothetical protein